MKYLPIFLFVIVCGGVIFFNAENNKRQSDYDYLRIHIRANSNENADQMVKYLVKDEIVDFVTPYLIGCDTKEKSVEVISVLLPEIERECNRVLASNGFNYKSSAEIAVEHFPTRTYENITLDDGWYDALIIELGSGKGDNWWCMVYPPLCFVNKSENNVHNIQYQSYLMKIIEKYFS